MSTLLNGLHAPNRAISKGTLSIIRAGGFQSVKLLSIPGCQHSLAEGKACLDAGAKELMLRLPNSKQASGNYPSYGDYAHECLILIEEWHKMLGVNLFEMDNEPNWQWTTELYGPWNYQWFIKKVMLYMRTYLPNGVKIISPPLSFSPALWKHGELNPTHFTLDEWIQAFDFTDLGRERNVWQCFDYIGANSYFRSCRQLADPSYGQSYKTMFNRSGGEKSVVVTEWGNTMGEQMEDGKPVYTSNEIGLARKHQYPDWLAAAKECHMVERAYLWLAPSSTIEWSRDEITEDTAKYLAAL